MVRRILALGLLASFACSSESSSEASPKQPVEKQPVEKPVADPSEKPVAELPEHISGQVVTITAALARSKGLPPLGFSLDFTDTAFTASPFLDGSYLVASGPPGGPLSLRVSPVARNAEFAGIVGGSELETKPKSEQIDLLGAKRPAVAWISGESMARTSWCAFIVAPQTGDDALLIELGVGHSQADITCKTALGHDELAKVIASLRFE
jgi:hypothetical protein